eukprot:14675484-Alexandrium_andersonii.AAC.1
MTRARKTDSRSTLPTSGWSSKGSSRSPLWRPNSSTGPFKAHPRAPLLRRSQKRSAATRACSAWVSWRSSSQVAAACSKPASLLTSTGEDSSNQPVGSQKSSPPAAAQQKHEQGPLPWAGNPKRSRYSVQSPL